MLRKAFAEAHNVSLRTAYSYQDNHPVELRRLQVTEKFTDLSVTRFDLLPDVFQKDEITTLLRAIDEHK